MTEHAISEVRVEEAPYGSTHTTIIREPVQEKRAGVGGWLMLALVLMLGVGGLVIYNEAQSAEAVRDIAIADAAGEVGEAANQVGDAVERGVDQLTQ